jgi:hypothetical protein
MEFKTLQIHILLVEADVAKYLMAPIILTDDDDKEKCSTFDDLIISC